MAKQSTLKSGYTLYLWGFLAINVVVFWGVVVTGSPKIDLSHIYESIGQKELSAFILGPLAVLVLKGLLSSDLKTALIYLRCKNPLPANYAFSKYIGKDSRIDTNALRKKHGSLPKEPVEQNRLWYKIYRTIESDVAVRDSHYNWLFSRDAFGLAVVFLITFGGVALFFQPPLLFLYLAILFSQVAILWCVSRNYGDRFVCTVLAVGSTD